MAKETGMSQQGIQSILAGDSGRPRLLREIAEAVETSEAYLLDETDDPTPAIGPSARPGVTGVDRRPGSNENSKLVGRLGELFAAILKANEQVQLEAVEALEELVPSRQRSRVTKTNEQS